MTDPTFSDLDLDPRLLAAVEELGFTEPTPIQAEAIPHILEGRDVLGGARTGSGKTAAFGLPLLHRVREGGAVRALVLAPTRELALQVTRAIEELARGLHDVSVVTVYGGAPYGPQIGAIRGGVTVIVGTPGRVIDLADNGHLDLSTVEMFVLDEADEMLRMGFVEDVEKLLEQTGDRRQVVLFSATLPDRIQSITRRYMRDPVAVQVEEEALTVDHIDQSWIRVPHHHKLDALERVLTGTDHGTTLVFCRTRAGCAEVADALAQRGIAADALHGDLNQNARERVLARLRAQRLRVLIATDVAARGIDVEHITHVINMDLPDDTEVYVHRIGRTGRAGREGQAITFVTPREIGRLRRLQGHLGTELEPMDVPSDAAIARSQRNTLRDRLAAQLAEGVEMAREQIDSWLEDSETDPRDVAAAALMLLAHAEGHDIDEIPEEGLPDWARPTKAVRPEHRASSGPPPVAADMLEVFLPAGRNLNLRPSDFVGAIAGDLNVRGNQIGRIQIMSKVSFVELPRQVAIDLVNRGFLNLRGRDVPALPSKGRGGPPPSGPRGGGGARLPKKKFKGRR